MQGAYHLKASQEVSVQILGYALERKTKCYPTISINLMIDLCDVGLYLLLVLF